MSPISAKTLLEGDIKKEIIRLAIPLLIGNILQQLYNTIDALIVGHFLGTDAFAAVGIAGTIMNLFIFVLNGFCIGLSIIFAQLYGAGNEAEFRKEVFVSISIGTAITVVLSALFLATLTPILQLIHTPLDLMHYVTSYLKVIIVGMIATYFYNLFSNILRALGDTKAALFFLFLSIVINTVVAYVLIAVFSFGVAGTAYATVLAQIISAACCYFYLKKHYEYLLCKKEDIGLHMELIKKSLGFGFASALQQASLYIGKILVQGSVNTLGTPGIAAYTATMRIEGFANSFGDSGAQAMSVIISQNYGAGNKKRVSDALRQGLFLHIVLGIALSLILFVTAKAGMIVFLEQSEVAALEYGVSYLHIISVFYVLCFIGNAFVGYFRGIGKVLIPVAGTTLHIGLRVILSYLLVGRLGLSAVALATGLGWVLVVVFHSFSYQRVKKTAYSACTATDSDCIESEIICDPTGNVCTVSENPAEPDSTISEHAPHETVETHKQ